MAEMAIQAARTMRVSGVDEGGEDAGALIAEGLLGRWRGGVWK